MGHRTTLSGEKKRRRKLTPLHLDWCPEAVEQGAVTWDGLLGRAALWLEVLNQAVEEVARGIVERDLAAETLVELPRGPITENQMKHRLRAVAARNFLRGVAADELCGVVSGHLNRTVPVECFLMEAGRRARLGRWVQGIGGACGPGTAGKPSKDSPGLEATLVVLREMGEATPGQLQAVLPPENGLKMARSTVRNRLTILRKLGKVEPAGWAESGDQRQKRWRVVEGKVASVRGQRSEGNLSGAPVAVRLPDPAGSSRTNLTGGAGTVF